MKKTIIVLGLTILIINFANAQKSFSLEEAIEYGIENNTEVKNAKLSIQDAEAQILERKSIGMPRLNGSLKYDYYPQVPKQKLPNEFTFAFRDSMGNLPPDFSEEISFLLKNNFTAGINASALVFDGSYLSALEAARVFKSYVQADLTSKEKIARDAVIDAYLPSLLITESLKTLDKNIKNLEQVKFETEEIFKAGFAEQLDVERLELSLANLISDKEELERNKDILINALKFAMNYPVKWEIDLSDDLNTLLAEATTEQLSADVNPSDRPEYKVAEMGIKLNEINVTAEERGKWPSLSAYGAYQYQYQGNNFTDGFWAPTFLVGAQLNIPIYDGGESKAKVERAKIGLESARNQQKMLVNLIELQVQNARKSYLSAKANVESKEKNLALAEKIYKTTKIKYKEGVGSSLEVSSAEQALYQTQQNHIQALYNMLLAKMELEKVLGR